MNSKKSVIFNADDFGFSEAVNYGILKAHINGLVTSTSLMANMPGFDHAVSLLKKHPTLRVGVHLNITCGKPVLDTHTTMTSKEGYFEHGKEHNYSDYEIYEELCTQIDKITNAGILIDHIDSHHHIHTEERFQKVIEKLLRKYPFPIRGGFLYENDYPYQSILCTEFYDQGVSLSNLIALFDTFETGKVYDLMCHPAYLDDVLIDFSSYRLQRIEELRILCDPKAQEALATHNVEAVTYNCI